MNARERELRAQLQMFDSMAGAVREGWHYRSMYDFVLKHGEFFEPRALPEAYDYGAPKCCFGNAVLMGGVHGLGYVEGFALCDVGFPIHHAWNVDDEGRLVDITWRAYDEETHERFPMPKAAYLGIRFSLGRADHAAWIDDATVLDCYATDFALYRQPWTGEDETIEWEPSELLDAIRSEDPRGASKALLLKEGLL